MSKDLNQLDLLEKPRPRTAVIDHVSMLDTIKRRPTLLRAINLAVEVSGLEDKQIYSQLKIDTSHWTRIKNGTAYFPLDETFTKFFATVGNEIPLVWLAETCGYDWRTIRQHRSSVERENEELKQKVADQERVIQLLAKARGST